MVLVKLLDNNSNIVRLEDGIDSSQFPNSVSTLEIGVSDVQQDLDDEALVGCVDVDYVVLNRMLQGTTRKLKKIYINTHMPGVPEYLAVLLSAVKSTNNLTIYAEDGDFDDERAFASLTTGLLDRDGPKWLNLNSVEISSRQAQLLSLGIAQSSCLEVLDLDYVDFEDDVEGIPATVAFLYALTHTRTLKRLRMDKCISAHYQAIFRAAIMHAKVKSLHLHNDSTNDCFLDWGIVSQVLSSNDCEVEYLALSQLRMVEINGRNENAYESNTSVKGVGLSSMKLRDSDLTIIGSIFKSSVKIELEYNEFNNLAPLDCLLIGDNLKLRLLSLQCCEIDENCIVDFFRKLPQMTHIRHIDLNGNPFLTNSHEWRNVLLHMVQQNASLECITISTDNEDRRALYSRLDLAFGTNRAWRRHMENDCAEHSSKALPSTLWPMVLERATRISYFSCGGRYGTPQISKADVVFWLVKERMAAELPFTP